MASINSESKSTDSSKHKKSKTAYQGRRRMFGQFRCPQCLRTWASGNTWANTTQQCKSCLIEVLPYRQETLKRTTVLTGPGKEHPQHLCGMCKKLGRYCRDWEEYEDLTDYFEDLNIRDEEESDPWTNDHYNEEDIRNDHYDEEDVRNDHYDEEDIRNDHYDE
uniref:3CxxC-type domain-containing protein n=1 Tax=Clytia hemisphaerica TaxID=252671 RepID=A0A7M5V1D2_9CNID